MTIQQWRQEPRSHLQRCSCLSHQPGGLFAAACGARASRCGGRGDPAQPGGRSVVPDLCPDDFAGVGSSVPSRVAAPPGTGEVLLAHGHGRSNHPAHDLLSPPAPEFRTRRNLCAHGVSCDCGDLSLSCAAAGERAGYMHTNLCCRAAVQVWIGLACAACPSSVSHLSM